MADITNPADLRGKKLVDPAGGDIGEVQEVYLDHETDRPEFALVKTGLLGRKSTFVPLTGASLDGPRVWVEVEKGQVGEAPTMDPDAELSVEQEKEIYRHYGISGPAPSTTDVGGRADPETDLASGEDDAGREATDSSSGDSSSEMRSADEPGTATREQEATEVSASEPSTAETAPPVQAQSGSERGLPRLRRYTVTEEVEVKVPVQREEVRVEPPDPQAGEGQGDRESRPEGPA